KSFDAGAAGGDLVRAREGQQGARSALAGLEMMAPHPRSLRAGARCAGSRRDQLIELDLPGVGPVLLTLSCRCPGSTVSIRAAARWCASIPSILPGRASRADRFPGSGEPLGGR